MIRFILRRGTLDAVSGVETGAFETVDLSVPELQALLERGGFGEVGFDHTELVGAELLRWTEDELTDYRHQEPDHAEE